MKRIFLSLFFLTAISVYAMDQEHISINYNPNMHLIIADCRDYQDNCCKRTMVFKDLKNNTFDVRFLETEMTEEDGYMNPEFTVSGDRYYYAKEIFLKNKIVEFEKTLKK